MMGIKNKNNEIDDQIHVAIVRKDLSDDYNRHTAATMVSIMEHCSCLVIFHILYDGMASSCNKKSTNININKYRDLVSGYSCEVMFHRVVLPEWINEDNISALKIYGVPTGIYRFFIADILFDLERVISLGSDVIVNADLVKLWELNLDDYYLAGVIDQGFSSLIPHKNWEINCNQHGIPMDTYVNADVLIFNLGRIRKDRMLPEKAISYFKMNSDVQYLDQDVFNYLFHGNILILPDRYNILVNRGDAWVNKVLLQAPTDVDADYILHFAGTRKPWTAYYSKYDVEYWINLSKTPWGGGEQLICYLQNALSTPDDYYHNFEEYVWGQTFLQKIKILWSVTLPLWVCIIKYYGKQLFKL